jgi:AraC-like DNA-binding protein
MDRPPFVFALSGRTVPRGHEDGDTFLPANFRKEIRLPQVLEATSMSRATFSRQFRKHAGKTLSRFLKDVRLEAACRELRETDRLVIDVALGNGFSQISFVNRVFRRALRCSPTRYRQRHQRKLPVSEMGSNADRRRSASSAGQLGGLTL